MEMIKCYIQEVTRRLPEKGRDDIALELESTIYDMLPEEYSEADVYGALETLGDPVILASKYHDRPMHLIGPKYYDTYVTLLKLIVPIAVLSSLIALIAVKLFSPVESGAVLETVLHLLGEGIWNVITVFIHTFFWLTISFVIIERVDVVKADSRFSISGKGWSPKDLKQTVYVPKYKAIRSFELASGLVWTAMWATTYFYADHLVGLYKSGTDGLRMVTPAFNSEVLMSFWPLIVLLIAVEIALTICKVITKQWTYKLATFFTVHQVLLFVSLVLILMRENIFTTKFLVRMGDIFATTPTTIESATVKITITMFLVFGCWGIFDVYKRARIKSDETK